MIPLIIYSLTAGAATLLGAVAVLAKHEISRDTLSQLMGFGSGVLIGTAFLHLVPESIERSSLAGGWAMLGGLVAFIAIERFIHARACRHDVDCRTGIVGIMGFTALAVHSLIDGVAIAAGLRASPELGLVAAVAVVAHELPEGITSVSLFTAAGYSRRVIILLAVIVAAATPIGALASWYWTAGAGDVVISVLLGVAASSFIYVATADILPYLHEQRQTKPFIYLLAGVVIPILLLFISV